MARLRFGFCPKPEDERLRGLGLTDDSRTGFRPVDADDVSKRRNCEAVLDRAAQDGTTHVSTVGFKGRQPEKNPKPTIAY